MTQNSIKSKFSNPPLPTGPGPDRGRGRQASPALLKERVAVLNPTLALDGEEGLSFSFQVKTEDQGRRLDQFLAETDLHLSRSQAKNLIEKHYIYLNQKPTKPSAHVKAGNTVSGTLPGPRPLSLKPEPIPLTTLYEDSSIIVVDKAPGMVVHPAHGNPFGTLVNALLYHCKDLAGINGVLRPGIVHRLDKDTSGVMVIAKDDEAFHQLTKQFKNRTIGKVYLALVYGKFSQNEGLIDSAIGRHPSQRKRMSTRAKKGKSAITRWRKVEEFDSCTLLEIFPKTGRTHQIRVHLSSIGHPLLGDPVYGRKGRPGAIHDPVLRECVKKLNRQALHAQRLELTHPRTGKMVQFVAPIPEDLSNVMSFLRRQESTSS